MDVRDDAAVEGVAQDVDGIDAEPGRPLDSLRRRPTVGDV
jgi:hypothetical protein